MDKMVLEHLINEYYYYKSKLIDVENICSKYSVVLNTIVKPKMIEHGIINETIQVEHNQESNNNDITLPSSNTTKTKEIKSIFRKIAKVIHPDISTDNFELYQQVQKMYDTDDIFNLNITAHKLGISVDLDYSELKNKIYEIKVIINNKMNSYEWLYANTISDADKEILILEYTSKLL